MCFGAKCVYQPKKKSKRPWENVELRLRDSVCICSKIGIVLTWARWLLSETEAITGQKEHLKAILHLEMQGETATFLFGGISDQIKKCTCVFMMTIHKIFRNKWESLQTQEHRPTCELWGWQHKVVSLVCCRKDWCTSPNRLKLEERILCRNIETRSIGTTI